MQLIDALRHATRPTHEALHVHPLLAPLSAAGITLEDYRWIIAAFHTAYRQMEAARSPTLCELPDAPVMRWLEQDRLRHYITIPELAPISYPPINSTPRLMGYLYVKQGSTLGGRVISKHLNRTLGLQEGVNNAFFAGYGEQTGARWKEFLAQLSVCNEDIAECVAQAVATFAHITRCCDAMAALKQQAPPMRN